MTANLGIYIAGPAVLAILCFVHEMGHILVARHNGVQIKQVRIGMGPILWSGNWGATRILVCCLPVGVTMGICGRRNLDGSPRRTLGQEAWIASGGLIANLIVVPLALGGMYLTKGTPLAYAIYLSGLLSLALVLLNALPIPGLDGGHLAMLALASAGIELSPAQERQAQIIGL